MIADAVMPVTMKTNSIEDIILPSRFRFDMPATADEIEKKTSGTMAVNRRFRKISPKGFSMAASFLRTIPRTEPRSTERIRSKEKP